MNSDSLENDIQSWQMDWDSLLALSTQHQAQTFEDLSEIMTQNNLNLKQRLLEIVNKLTIQINCLSNNVNELVRKINAEIAKRRNNERFYGKERDLLDADFLNNLQLCCEGPVKMARFTLKLIHETNTIIECVFPSLEIQESSKLFNILKCSWEQYTASITSLIQNTFLVVQEPPRVVKKNTKFPNPVILCSLVGENLLMSNSPRTEVQVKAIIIHNNQTNSFLIDNRALNKEDERGVLLNNTEKMNYNVEYNKFMASFSLQLQSITRPNTSSSSDQGVIIDPFRVLFCANFLAIGKIQVPVRVISMPINVIVHTTQDSIAEGAAFWINNFSTIEYRFLYTYPKTLSWNHIAEALNFKFFSDTGRSLSADDVHYLKTKLIESDLLNRSNEVSMTQFLKEHLPGKRFSFWDWCNDITKLLKGNLNVLWRQKYVPPSPQSPLYSVPNFNATIDSPLIHGFVSKSQADQMLCDCPEGTFLLRFSDSQRGQISLVYITNENWHKEVIHLKPFSFDELAERSLPDRLYSDGENLLYLYPNIPKEEAFGKYRSTATSENTLTRKGNNYRNRLRCEMFPGMKIPRVPESSWFGDPGASHSTSCNTMPDLNDHVSFGVGSGNPDLFCEENLK